MKFSNRMRAAVALVACAAVGSAGGIAGSPAAQRKKAVKSAQATPAASARPPHGDRGGPGGPGGPGRAVHSEEVVLNMAGDAFITETEDGGKVKSVSGRDVTITEGIGSVTYKDVTIALPADARIERNARTATVDELKAGDRIHVTQSSDGVLVHAADASFAPPRFDRHGPGDPRPGDPRPGDPRPG